MLKKVIAFLIGLFKKASVVVVEEVIVPQSVIVVNTAVVKPKLEELWEQYEGSKFVGSRKHVVCSKDTDVYSVGCGCSACASRSKWNHSRIYKEGKFTRKDANRIRKERDYY